MADTVSVRIPEEDSIEINTISKLENKSKSNTLRDILNIGIKEKKLEIAIKKFLKKEITINKAAEITGIPLTLFMDILSERKISFHYTTKELEEDFEGLI